MFSVNRDIFATRFVCAAAVCVALAGPAAAQSERPGGGPFSGLFQGSPRDQPHTLDLRASEFVAWDDNLLAQTPGGGTAGDLTSIDPRFLKRGIASGFQSALAYGFRKNGARSQFQFSGDGSVQQFANGLGEPLWFHAYSVSTSLKTRITNKTSASFGAGTAYVPYFRYAPFLKNTQSDESPVGSDYGFAVDSSMVRSTSASASIENRFSKKSAISAGVGWDLSVIPGYQQTIIPGNVIPAGEQSVAPADGQIVNPTNTGIPATASGTVQRRSVQATFSHSLTRKLGFHVGYGIEEMRYLSGTDVVPAVNHSMNVGLGYGDGITFRFGPQTLSLSVGVSVARNGDPVSVVTSGKSTAFVVDGSATLSRPLGRNWGTSIGYVRGTNYVVGFREPLTTDAANAGVGGRLSSRLQLTAGVGAARGQQLFSGSSNGSVISYTASTKLTFAMFKYLGMYSQASYYRFSIPGDFMHFGFVPDLDRRTFSVGLSTWVPLIKRRPARRDSDPQPTAGQP
jgi:hypothetical protein